MDKNKELANSMFEDLFVQKNLDAVEKYLDAQKYIQHDPRLEGGIEGKKKFLQTVKNNKPYRVLADRDLLVFHGRLEYLSKKPEISFDVVRIENNKIVEHWAIYEAEVFPGQAKENELQKPSGAETVGAQIEPPSQLGGTCDVGDSSQTEKTRAFAEKFNTDILINRQFDKLSNYLDNDNYTEHDYHLPYSGGDGIKKFIEIAPFWKLNKLHRLIVEGNFFFSHGEGEVAVAVDNETNLNEALKQGETIQGIIKGLGGEGNMKMAKYSLTDLWRVENGKIVEHWDAGFLIPDKALNENGVF